MRMLLILICASAIAPGSFAQTTAPTDEIEQVIAQLSSEDWQARLAAAETLVRQGVEVVPRLQQLLADSADPEVRSLVETALAQIDQNRRIGPSIITIRARAISVQDLIARLSEQAGAKLETAPPNLVSQLRGEPVELDIDRQPFWEAMRQITAKTNLSLVNWGNRELRLVTAQPPQGPTVVSGPYMLVATRISRTQTIDLTNQIPPQRNFVVQLTVMAEPKLRVLRAGGAAKVERAVDENGASLALPESDANRFGHYQQMGNSWQVSVPLLESPEHTGRRIAVLRGTIQVELCTKFERMEIGEPLASGEVERAAGPLNLRFLSATKRDDGYEVRVRAEVPATMRRDSSSALLQDIALFDDQGRSLLRRASSIGGRDNVIEATLQFSADQSHDGRRAGAPVKFAWTVPVEMQTVSAPFEFTDLPIP